MAESDSATQASTARISFRAIAVLAVVALAVYGLDQFTKYLVTENLTVGSVVPFIDDLLHLRYVKNPGAAFSIGNGATWIFSIIASAVVVFIVVFARRIRSVAWAIVFGLLLGGNIGNLTDRLFREPGFAQGHVIDFLELWGFPAIFNVADIAIVSSMGLFVILTIRGTRLDGRRHVHAAKSRADSADPPPTLDADQ